MRARVRAENAGMERNHDSTLHDKGSFQERRLGLGYFCVTAVLWSDDNNPQGNRKGPMSPNRILTLETDHL